MYKEYHSRFLQDMEHKQFAISVSVITPVAVSAILILGTLATISSTSQVFAYISYHKGHYHKDYYHKGNHGYYTTYRHTRHGQYNYGQNCTNHLSLRTASILFILNMIIITGVDLAENRENYG